MLVRHYPRKAPPLPISEHPPEGLKLAAANQVPKTASRKKTLPQPDPREAALDPLAAAKLAKLRHVSDDMPGITRHKARSGFDYRLPSGELVRDIETLKRIRSLVIPPAWTAVWICLFRTDTSKPPGGTSGGASS